LKISELKKRISKLLEEDEEFRLYIASKIGLLDILNEIKKLREDFNKMLMRMNKHDEKFNAIFNEIKDIRRTINRLAMSLEEEAHEVVSYFLEEKYGIVVDLYSIEEEDFEIDIYGYKDGLCIIGEASVRLGLADIRNLLNKVGYLKRKKRNVLRDNIVLVLYGMKILPKVVKEAEKFNIWVVTATKEYTKLKKIKIDEI